MPIYYISGLGATERAFEKLDFVKNENAVYLPWLSPAPNESISSYAVKMAEKISDADDNIVIGLSFGGMIGVEIAKIKKIKKVILISSCKTADEVPPYFKLSSQMGLLNIIPTSFIKSSNSLLHQFLGCKSEEEKNMANDFLKQVDTDYLSWAMRAICNWQNKILPDSYYHIHGTNDMLLPSSYVKADKLIEQGNHFMIMNRAAEINEILNAQLRQG